MQSRASANALANGDLNCDPGARGTGSRLADRGASTEQLQVEGQIAVALYLAERYDWLAELSSGWLDDARRRGSLPRFISMATLRAHAGI